MTNNSGFLLKGLMTPLDAFFDDPDITEIAINKAGECWLMNARVGGWIHVKDDALTTEKINALVSAMATYNGLGVSRFMSPTLPGGQRVHVARGGAVYGGHTAINIRKHVDKAFTLDELVENGAFDKCINVSRTDYSDALLDECLRERKVTNVQFELLKVLRDEGVVSLLIGAVKKRLNILIVGQTGSGKTTLCRSLINMVPSDERIITIEDTHELKLDHHNNSIHLMYDKNGVGVSAKECLEACMRMTASRVFLAELRGDEAWDYLKLLYSGHPGSITTSHAEGCYGAIDKMVSMLIESPSGARIPYRSLVKKVTSTVDVILWMHNRKVLEVYFDPINELE